MYQNIDGERVLVTRARIKNMYLYVRPPEGSLEIRAPYGTGDKAIWDFVCSKKKWIEKKRRELSRKESAGASGFLDKGTFNYWGMEYDLQVSRGKRRSLELSDGRAELVLLPEDGEAEAETFVRAWYKKAMAGEVAARLPVIEERTGLKASSWTLRWMKTRWGSCNTGTHKICLNIQLAARPPIYLDYVITHELVHTKVPDHGPRFKAMMDRMMPGWRKLRKELNGKEPLG